MMKKITFLVLLYFLFAYGAMAQEKEELANVQFQSALKDKTAGASKKSTTAVSRYNPAETFAPLFYTSNGNEYRSANGSPGPKYWQNRADYSIAARLNEQMHTLTGKLTITYRNNSPDQLPFLWLQLDQNAFTKNSRSYMQNQGEGRFGGQNESIQAGYKIQNINITRGGKAVKFTELIEDTRMQLRFNEPMAANGDVITINMDYSYVLPQTGADRTGHFSTKNGEVYAFAQWFPRMCVYDDVLGWNTLPYWGVGEFYCEYGDITFTIDAPANHILMGSGELLNPAEVFTAEQLKRWNAAKQSETPIAIRSVAEVTNPSSRPNKNRLIWKYRITNARDAAWASSKAFVLEASRINLSSGKKALAVSAHPVESSEQDSYGRAVEYVKTSVEHYSKQWFEYPYPMAVNIASNQGGMEYPGIVFCDWKAKKADVWHVIDHEFGHTWFPMIVGTNERKYAWMDEGLNTFINGISSQNFKEYNNTLRIKELMYKRFFSSSFGDPKAFPIISFPDVMNQISLGLNAYIKPSWALNILREKVLGPERFDYAFRQYIKNWAYKHPTPYDFFRSMENAAGEDLAWLWRSWFVGNWKLDQSIDMVEVKMKDGKIQGYNITLGNNEQMAMPVVLTLTDKTGNITTLNLPVDIWMKAGKHTFFYPTMTELEKIELGEELSSSSLPDSNLKNNKWSATK